MRVSLCVQVAVANSLTSMLNFLLDLPGLEIEYDDMRARGDSVSQLGRQTARFSLLLPIQCARVCAPRRLAPATILMPFSLLTLCNYSDRLTCISLSLVVCRVMRLVRGRAVAVKMADKKMVQYILRTQSYQRWQWGPVSEYHLNLHGIDSVGESGQDVMEIVARLDASVEVQEMLLDSFMDGL